MSKLGGPVANLRSSTRQRERHGETRGDKTTAEYRVWAQMLGRCHNPHHKRYAYYGGRGIHVCERWIQSLACFLADMGRRPSSAHQLERINNDAGYGPDNCKWATRKEQSRNRRSNILLTMDGRTQVLSAWAEELNMPYFTLLRRVNLHWSDEEVLKTAVWDRRTPRRLAQRHLLTPAQKNVLDHVASSPDGVHRSAISFSNKMLARLLRLGVLMKHSAAHRAPYIITDAGRTAIITGTIAQPINVKDGRVEVANA